MEAQAWTSIGLLAATLFGTLFYLGARIDAQGSRIDAQGSRIDGLGSRIDALVSEVRSGFEAQGSRIDAQASEMRSGFEAQGSRSDGLSVRMDALAMRVEEQGAQLSDRIYQLGTKLDDHLRRHAS
jgi:hypothetical protein